MSTRSNDTSGTLMVSASQSSSLSLYSVSAFLSAFWMVMPSSCGLEFSTYMLMQSWLEAVLRSFQTLDMLMPVTSGPGQ